jgi:hypothetical protein
MDVFELSEQAKDIAARHGVDRVLAPEYRPENFARFVAKMALGYAVERYGLPAFEEIYVRSAILGASDHIDRWVGCPDRREFPKRPESTISVGFAIISGDDLIKAPLRRFAALTRAVRSGFCSAYRSAGRV